MDEPNPVTEHQQVTFATVGCSTSPDDAVFPLNEMAKPIPKGKNTPKNRTSLQKFNEIVLSIDKEKETAAQRNSF